MTTKKTTVKKVDKVNKVVEKSNEKTTKPYLVWKWKPPESAKWKKWQSWNPKWTPKRRTIEVCNAELVADWYPPATKQQIEELYMSMVNVGEEKLDQIIIDKELPMLNRIVARNMKGGKGFDIIERMIDRAHGKAVQKEEVKHTGLIATTDASSMTSAELDKYIAGIAW